jgi:hypothetical protein
MYNATASVTTASKHATKKVNEALYKIGLKYWDYIPVYEIDSALVENGFDATEAAIYCGSGGKVDEYVGGNKYLHLNWHKMESGRYEIVAYVN